MSCRLIQNIKHSRAYNPGGITDIYLLDIRDFISYRFTKDSMYGSCFIDLVLKKDVPYIRLPEVNESNFSETNDDGLYKQQLATFVGTLKYFKTSGLLVAAANRYLVAFRNTQGNVYVFGSDGGASLSFAQLTGQTGETAGYSVTLAKNSIYPLFEADASKFDKTLALGSESKRIMVTEDKEHAVLI